MKRIFLRRALAVLSGFALAAMLTACGPAAKTGSGSPSVTAQRVSVSNNGVETSQKVTVTFTFDRAVSVGKDVDRELAVTLNGKAVDSKSLTWTAAADGSDRKKLVFTLSALPTDTNPTNGRYFAVYDGRLVIAAKNGAFLPAVTDSSGKFAAKWAKAQVQIPSGVTLTNVSSQTGSASVPAQATVRVSSIGVIRAMTWVQFLKNSRPVMQKDYKKGSFSYTNNGSFPIHDHQLFQMTAEDYAKEIAAGLESYFGNGTPTAGSYTFTSSRDTITVKANKPMKGDVLSLQIFNRPDA